MLMSPSLSLSGSCPHSIMTMEGGNPLYLNYDCMRDVLITLAKTLDISIEPDGSYGFTGIYFDALMIHEDIAGYDQRDVIYALYNLQQAHYITATAFLPETDLRDVRVLDITYDGHMFLRSIQDITIWSTLKQRIGPALNASLPVLSEMAGKILLSKFP